ncbi:AraC family transcriptional regulator [Desulfovibrio sp.]|uniref:helix-turn-helix domain-containing protein n=1 Tax=Desulfovibrio sp. TaxID=885 RepID=UPI0025B8DF4D|nr:AraC family transcriptional regulator [Desulfovibrio sp.]
MACPYACGQETVFALPPGRNIFGLEVLSGVSLDMLDFYSPRDIVMPVTQRDRLEFAFVLSGEGAYMPSAGAARVMEAPPESGITFYMPGSEGSFHICGQKTVKMLGISMEASRLKTVLGLDEGHVLCRSLPACERARLSPAIKVLLTQFFSCSKSGPALALFLRGKALELLAEIVEHLGQECGNCRKAAEQAAFSANEVARIREARHILCANMAAPPSLPVLSGMVGMNLTKLKAGFHAVYGKAPFRCLHEERMKRAGSLLAGGEVNVSQAAWAVGYTSVGHFSAAFDRFFGVRPKTYQMDMARGRAAALAGGERPPCR